MPDSATGPVPAGEAGSRSTTAATSSKVGYIREWTSVYWPAKSAS